MPELTTMAPPRREATPNATATAPTPAPAPAATFVALSRFVIKNDMGPEVKAAFRARPHHVDSAPGFVGMQVLCPLDCAQEIWLVTQWASADAYHDWHHGHTYRDSHRGIPKGLKLVGSETLIREFEVICA